MSQKLFVLGIVVAAFGASGCSYISASGDWPPPEDMPTARTTHYQQLASGSAHRSTPSYPAPSYSQPSVPNEIAPKPFAPKSQVSNFVVEDLAVSSQAGSSAITPPPVVPVPIPPSDSIAPVIPFASGSADRFAGTADSGLPPARTAMTTDQNDFASADDTIEEKASIKREELTKKEDLAKQKGKALEAKKAAKTESAAEKPKEVEHSIASNEELPAARTEDRVDETIAPEQAAAEAAPLGKNLAAGSSQEGGVTPAKNSVEPEKSLAAAPEPAAEVDDPSGLPKAATSTTAEPTKSAAAAAAPKSGLSGDCQKAHEESTRAQAAVSDADRLFYYRRAVRLCPAEPSYHLEIGKIYAGLRRFEEAEQEFRRVLEAQPDNAEAKAQLTKFEQSDGR